MLLYFSQKILYTRPVVGDGG